MTAPTLPDAPEDQRPHDAPSKHGAPTRLSMTQVVASALAAVSATVLMSFFGIAGTIIGAGLASVVTVVGNFLYTRSIEKTHAQLKPVVAGMKPAGRSRAESTATSAATTTIAADPLGSGTPGSGSDDGDGAEPRNRWLRFVDRHGKVKVLAVSALALFAVVMGVVLTIELAIGKPISDAVRGQEGSGTSISRTTTTDDGDSTTVPASPAEDPANIPSDGGVDSDGGTGTSTGSSSGDTTDEQSDTTTDGTDAGTGGSGDTSTDGTTDDPSGDGTGPSTGGDDSGATNGGTANGGTTDQGTTGDGTTTDDDSSGSSGDSGSSGTDAGSGTDADPGSGTGTGTSDTAPGATPSSGATSSGS